MKKLGMVLVFVVSLPCFGQQARPTIYIEPQQGFETYLAAAIGKKGVPVDVVTVETKASYLLKAAPVEIKSESTGGKIARCMFAYCAGIEDKGNVSVQLIDAGSTKVLWAYSVSKQKGGGKNSQSMAEAVAKHLKDYMEHGAGKEELVADASGGQPTKAETSQAAGNPQTDSPVEPGPAALPASVMVKSNPSGADINIDGKFMGSTPSAVQLTPGEHQVSIEKEGMTPWQRTMTLTAGGSSMIDATLVKP
jgi:hypothetical protein